MPKKDPSKPKGRISAYAFFVQEAGSMLDEKDAKKTLGEKAKIYSKMWENLDEDKKDVYHQKAAADKERYDREMATYVPPADADTGKTKKKKKQKDKTKPKRNLTAFLFFSGDMRPKLKEEDPGRTVGELSKILGAKWGQMSEEEKEPYALMSQKDRERYENELELWKKGEFVRDNGEAEQDYSEPED